MLFLYMVHASLQAYVLCYVALHGAVKACSAYKGVNPCAHVFVTLPCTAVCKCLAGHNIIFSNQIPKRKPQPETD